jgi:RNA polymerase sigma factor (sigma-70 family)
MVTFEGTRCRSRSLSDRQTELLELLDKSGPGLFALLTRLTLRQDVAEELMQELFLRLSGGENHQGIECLAAYARRTAINLAFDWRRQRRRRETAPLEVIAEPLSHAPGPLADVIAAEEIEQILNAVDGLNGLSQQAFVMRYIQQESHETIAEQLGKTPHQVRALCFRAMQQVRDAVGGNHSPAKEKGAENAEQR